VKRDAQAILLLALAAGLAKLSLTGTATRYVHAGMVPLLLLAAVLISVLAGFVLWRSLLDARRQGVPAASDMTAASAASVVTAASVASAASAASEVTAASAASEVTEASGASVVTAASAASDASASEGADPIAFNPLERVPEPSADADLAGPARIGWLLLVPIAVALVVVPPPLGADQAGRYGTELARHAPGGFGPLAEGEPVRLTLVEYAARAVADRGRSLAGRRVSLEGFVIAGTDGRPYLARLVVSCCAADARPVKVGLVGGVPAGLSPGDWIQVEGGYTDRLDRDPLSGHPIPYLDVSGLRRIDPPTHPYGAS
jgi:uncharacterized repeat protein (TIGR03943 family)